MTADIFVAIPAYRDPDIVSTVHGVIANALHQCRVAVLLQDDPSTARTVGRELEAIGAEVEAREPAPERGVGWARNRLESKWAGEPWFCQCDAHMEFSPGWDAELLRVQHAASSPCVLTGFPPEPGEGPPEGCFEYGAMDLQFDPARSWSRPMQSGGEIAFPFWWAALTARPRPRQPSSDPARHLSTANVLMPSAFMRTVRADPGAIYWGEEHALMMRFWTHWIRCPGIQRPAGGLAQVHGPESREEARPCLAGEGRAGP